MSVANLQALLAPIVAPGALILADQNGPRPAKPYATLSVRTVTPARSIQLEPDTAGMALVVQHQYLSVELQHFGSGAFEAAQIAGLKLRTNTHALRAQVLGLGVSQIKQVLRVPELLNQTQFEERGILEFTVYDSLVVTDEVGLIESVDMDGSTTSDGKNDSPVALCNTIA